MSRDRTARDLAKDDNLIQLLQLAEDQGWRVTPTNNGKLMWYPKDKDQNPVTSPMRLIGRSLANVRTALERAGLDTSSLKPNKPKRRAAVIVSTNPDVVANPETPLSESEQVHADLQDILADTLSEIVQAMPDARQDKAHVINTQIDLFLLNTGKALMQFMTDTTEAFGCSHHVEDELKVKLEEAEKLYLETCNELEELRKHSDKQDAAVSRLGGELQTALHEKAEAQERALKAENRLRALRTALTED